MFAAVYADYAEVTTSFSIAHGLSMLQQIFDEDTLKVCNAIKLPENEDHKPVQI